jgi:hypothetical protein
MCSSRLGPDWIDDGTMCRSRSSPPGPLRFVMSLVMGAAPEHHKNLDLEKVQAEQAMIGYDIDCIADSPLGSTPDGRRIVDLLRRLHAAGAIAYGETDDDRGHFYGTGITVNKDFSGNLCKTIPTLVHEASHATWRARNPILKGHKESLKASVDNELYAEENELAIYKWLKDEKKLCSGDPELDLRLDRQKQGSLKSVIEEHEKENRNPAIKR